MSRFKGVATATQAQMNQVYGQPGTDILLMDGSITIGLVQVPLNDAYLLTNAVLTRNAQSDVSINVNAGENAAIYMMMGRYFKQVNAFLSTTSKPSINNSGYLSDTGDTPPLKGTMATNLILNYSVSGAALTAFTANLAINTYGNGVANSINTLIAASNVAPLSTTANATTCNQAVVPIAAPIFDIAEASAMTLELALTTPAGGTFRLYSVGLQVSFNHN